MHKPLQAEKIPGYVLEPLAQGASEARESHHATNPAAIRLSCDPRVFLGYRAGGAADYYRFGKHDVWGSHMGLAILDPQGRQVQHRFPLPVVTLVHDVKLPQDETEYERFMQSSNRDRILVLHDFRLYEWRDDLYLVYHEGPISDCYDCVCRMPVREFLDRVAESIELAARPAEQIRDRWAQLWWGPDVWRPCGYQGGNRIFPTYVNKGDIVYFELPDGALQMCHRPMADVIAVLDVGEKLYVEPTADGITRYGVVEQNARPGMTDNSHIGPNGAPSPARIGTAKVYIDVVHGCYDRLYSEPGCDGNHILYYPYFRVKDRATTELLYYSESPILAYDETWRAYAEHGTWVSSLAHLDGVMFVGGQLPVEPDKNGLDDEFVFFSGLGDTAVGRARFTLRQLLPDAVVADIQVRRDHLAVAVDGIEPNAFELPEPVHGWTWVLRNNPQRRTLEVVRRLVKDGREESAVREINTRPGYFDADAMVFDGAAVRLVDRVGWVLAYRAARWQEQDGSRVTTQGCGLMILDHRNPEKVLYRSGVSVVEPVERAGWGLDVTLHDPAALVDGFEAHVPPKVMGEIRLLRDLEDAGKARKSQYVCWLKQKSGQLDVGTSPNDM